MDKNIGHAEVWYMLSMILKTVPEIIPRLGVASEAPDTRWWAIPIYELAILTQQHTSITAAIANSGQREKIIRSWLTQTHEQARAHAFVDWLGLEGFAVRLINVMGLAPWPWFSHYLTFERLMDPVELRPFVTHPGIAGFLAQSFEQLMKDLVISQQRTCYAQMVISGSLKPDVLLRAVRLAEEEREVGQQPVTEQEKVLQELGEIQIEDLDFSVRTYNCLKKAKKMTVRDLIETDVDGYMDIRNFGRTSFVEVIKKLKQFGLTIKGWTESDEKTWLPESDLSVSR